MTIKKHSDAIEGNMIYSNIWSSKNLTTTMKLTEQGLDEHTDIFQKTDTTNKTTEFLRKI